MFLVFIYYAYVYNVLHFILNKSINQSNNINAKRQKFKKKTPAIDSAKMRPMAIDSAIEAFSGHWVVPKSSVHSLGLYLMVV